MKPAEPRRELRRPRALPRGWSRGGPSRCCCRSRTAATCSAASATSGRTASRPREELTAGRLRAHRARADASSARSSSRSRAASRSSARISSTSCASSAGATCRCSTRTAGTSTRTNARALFDAGLAQVGVSIDYPDAARHDAKRGLAGGVRRAPGGPSITLRDAAPHGGTQVHVMTVLMARQRGGHRDAAAACSAAHGVGHCVDAALHGGLSPRRSGRRSCPDAPASPSGCAPCGGATRTSACSATTCGSMDAVPGRADRCPRASAGEQSFNIDHVGNVSPCIEKIDHGVGQRADESLAAIHRRMRSCRPGRAARTAGRSAAASTRPSAKEARCQAWRDFATRMRST